MSDITIELPKSIQPASEKICPTAALKRPPYE